VGDDLLRRGFNVEDGREHRPLCAEANYIRRRLVAHQERERVNQNGLACASFSSQEIQPSAELNCKVINDGVILEAQFKEHGRSRQQS